MLAKFALPALIIFMLGFCTAVNGVNNGNVKIEGVTCK